MARPARRIPAVRRAYQSFAARPALTAAGKAAGKRKRGAGHLPGSLRTNVVLLWSAASERRYATLLLPRARGGHAPKTRAGSERGTARQIAARRLPDMSCAAAWQRIALSSSPTSTPFVSTLPEPSSMMPEARRSRVPLRIRPVTVDSFRQSAPAIPLAAAGCCSGKRSKGKTAKRFVWPGDARHCRRLPGHPRVGHRRQGMRRSHVVEASDYGNGTGQRKCPWGTTGADAVANAAGAGRTRVPGDDGGSNRRCRYNVRRGTDRGAPVDAGSRGSTVAGRGVGRRQFRAGRYWVATDGSDVSRRNRLLGGAARRRRRDRAGALLDHRNRDRKGRQHDQVRRAPYLRRPRGKRAVRSVGSRACEAGRRRMRRRSRRLVDRRSALARRYAGKGVPARRTDVQSRAPMRRSRYFDAGFERRSRRHPDSGPVRVRTNDGNRPRRRRHGDGRLRPDRAGWEGTVRLPAGLSGRTGLVSIRRARRLANILWRSACA